MAIENSDNKSTSIWGFLGRMLVWAMLGGIRGLRGWPLARFAFFGPLGERVTGFRLEQLPEELARLQREREIRERLVQFQQFMEDYMNRTPTNTSAPGKAQASPTPFLDKELAADKDSKWLRVIVHPSVVIVVGKRGSGKSALGYRLLELFRYIATPYVLGIPARAQRLLPEWVGIAQDLDDIPPGSIVLIDEAYLTYHSRESLKTQSREMSRIVNLSRQRNQTLIFVTQEARQVDKNIASQANVAVFKELGMLQLKFDRPELNDIATGAKRAFDGVNGDKRKWAYVYSSDADFMGLLENSLPTFWSSELGRAFASGEPVSVKRMATKLTKEDKIAKAKELRESGLSYRQIAKILVVNEGTAYNYVNDYPYKR
jgi:hypothetical protein